MDARARCILHWETLPRDPDPSKGPAGSAHVPRSRVTCGRLQLLGPLGTLGDVTAHTTCQPSQPASPPAREPASQAQLACVLTTALLLIV